MSDPGVDTAWKTHAAIADWTGKVDTKASFALTLEAAALSAVVLLTRPDQPLSRLGSPLGIAAFWLGCTALAIAALMAVSVVIPRTRSGKTAEEWRENYIYFGHLRYWSADDLALRLSSAQEAEILLVLSRQLVNMSKIAWTKHRRVQWSLWLAAIGVILTTTAGLSG